MDINRVVKTLLWFTSRCLAESHSSLKWQQLCWPIDCYLRNRHLTGVCQLAWNFPMPLSGAQVWKTPPKICPNGCSTFGIPKNCLHSRAIPGADEMPKASSLVLSWQACAEYIKSAQPTQTCREFIRLPRQVANAPGALICKFELAQTATIVTCKHLFIKVSFYSI